MRFCSRATSKLYNFFLVCSRRFYYVDRYRVQHFRPSGPKRWFQNPRTVLIVVLVSSGVVITVHFGNLETIPYTKRTHLVLLSKPIERKLGETRFQQYKSSSKGKTLPAIHPESIRVRLISKDIIEALQRGLKQENVWSDLPYASDSYSDGSDSKEWKEDEDEILDDKWDHQSRKKGEEKGSQAQTSHLDGLNWEVLVVDEPVVNAFCLPGGKIVVFTGLFEHFRNRRMVEGNYR